jgi:hypothetical protein
MRKLIAYRKNIISTSREIRVLQIPARQLYIDFGNAGVSRWEMEKC